MSEFRLKDVFEHESIKSFGKTLRKMIRPPKEGNKEKWASDYASIVELGYVETKDQFAEVIKKLLRRYDVIAKKHQLKRPTEKNLEELMELIDKYGVKPVRAALISYALVKKDEE
ncbi:MAG: hypothetical protein HVN34_05740 [Methanobacteriaceae archaeon]|jgi:hypothetical protein|nr:hypothetical protein [Methanobacteriaceae archaeon]